MEFTEEQVLALARDAYAAGVAGFPLDADRASLLVIDMQDEFVKPGWTPYWVPDATRQVDRIGMLVDAARRRSMPVIWTVFSATHHNLDRPAAGSLMPNRLPGVEHDDEWFRRGRVWHELRPLPEEVVIHKPSYGAFYDTPLETILRNLGRDTVVVCGTLTCYCCSTTARQAYERGFNAVVAADACANDDPDLQEHELRVLRKGFARVLDTDEIVALLA